MLSRFLSDPTFAVLWIGIIIIGITIHEAAHSYAAKWLGDPTPDLAGRTTLDPLAHLDPLGSLLILLVGFGWGKPAPFNPTYFKRYKRDTALVAIAGPFSNLLLVSLCILILKISLAASGPQLLLDFLSIGIQANLILAIFNLIPIPPLDGSKVLYALLPDSLDDAYHQFEQLGPFLLIILLIFGGGIVFTILNPILGAISRFLGA